MNRTEVVALLAYISGRDNRKPDDLAAEAWFEDVGDLPFEDSKQAVRHHFQTTTDYLMPFHIRSTVKAIRSERIRAAGDLSLRIPAAILAIEDDAAHDIAYRQWLKAATRRIGDGEPLDDVAPRLQAVNADTERIKAIAEHIARNKRAPGTEPRDEDA